MKRKHAYNIHEMRIVIATVMFHDECFESFEEAEASVKTWDNDTVLVHWEVFEPYAEEFLD